MAQHIKTITKTVHHIPSSAAADPTSAATLAASGTLAPVISPASTVTVRRVAPKVKPGVAPKPRPFLHRVTTFTTTIHSVPDAAATDTPTALAALAAGKGILIETQTHTLTARIPLRAVSPSRVVKQAPAAPQQ